MKVFVFLLLTLWPLRSFSQTLDFFLLHGDGANSSTAFPYKDETITVYFELPKSPVSNSSVPSPSNGPKKNTPAKPDFEIRSEEFKTNTVGWVSITVPPNAVSLRVLWNGSPACGDGKYVLELRGRANLPKAGGIYTQKVYVEYPRLTTSELSFDTGKSVIKETEGNLKVLEQMASFIFNHQVLYPCRTLQIQGHTDNQGDPEKNQALSEARALAIHTYISKTYKGSEEHDLDMSKVTYRGFGATKPIETNKTEEGRKKNRRVEVVILSDEEMASSQN